MVPLKLLTVAFIGVVGLVYTVYYQRSQNYRQSNNNSSSSSPKFSEEKKCNVCQKLTSDEICFQLQCGHNLHLDCIFSACCIVGEMNCLITGCRYKIKLEEKKKILLNYQSLHENHFK